MYLCVPTVTYAAGSGMDEDAAAADAPVVDADGSDEDALGADLTEAALLSWKALGAPVYVRAASTP